MNRVGSVLSIDGHCVNRSLSAEDIEVGKIGLVGIGEFIR
jgi:hypothetical protein